MKRWLKIILAVVVGVPALLYAVGLFVPRDHVASMTIDLAAPPNKVWAYVSDVANIAKSLDEVPFEVKEQTPPSRQVVRIVDDEQPFGGTWTWELEPAGTGTRLKITEAGFVKSPIFRAMGLFFFSPTDSIDGYLRALARTLGETAEPR